MLKAKDIMTHNVITVALDTNVNELAKLLSSSNISGVPVVSEDNSLLGIVTENDLIDQNKKVHIPTVITILDSVFYLENPERFENDLKKMAGATVKDIYSSPAISVKEDTPLDEIATLMAEKNIHTLPVTKDKKIIGVIGKKDVIKTMI